LGIPYAWADISVQNDQKFLDREGYLHILGEVENHLNVPLNQIEILVTLYSKDNEAIGTMSASSLLNTIMPGMKGPFELVILGSQAKMVDSYFLDVEYTISEPKGQVIDITSSELERDKFDNLMIIGTIANKGEITANSISIVATLYDREGNVAAVSRAFAKPDYLGSNDEIFFLVSVPDREQTKTIVDYSVIAESEEYTAVPEFPLGSLLLLGGSVSAYLVLIRYSSKVIPNLVCASNPT